jgi:ribonuclease G
MKEFMKNDRSKFTALPLSRFGLMQITRQRVRPEMNIKTTEICPACAGSGKIAPSILISDQVEKDLDFLLSKQNEPSITISMHPYLFAFFTKGLISKKVKWYFKYHKKITLIQDSSLALTDYVFTNKMGEQIEI